jgi:FKBP-type peptidyl-prolyl cis-trans isomerase FklB
MRPVFANTLLLTLVAALISGPALAQDLETDKGKLSYAMGYRLGMDIGQNPDDYDVEALVTALRDAANGTDPQVPQQEMVSVLQAHELKVRQAQQEAFLALAEENRNASETWLTENKTKTGIVELPSGVQYRIIEEGDGQRPGLESTVKVHYRGSKMDGREFDSSFARGVPEEFTVNTVLQGWQEVLPLMKTGSTWQIFVPPELAFGERGNPPVGPNEALSFDLKLVEIVE